MATVLLVPGWNGSGAGHWQTLWADRLAGAQRLRQQDWARPQRDAWVAALADHIARLDGPVVLAAHSLGCIAVSHLPPEASARVAGALLVAPADPERRALFQSFCPVPAARLPYRSIVAASSNDPYCPVRTAGAYARSWGSEFLRLPDAGHINAESGHGDWPMGLALLQSFVQPLAGNLPLSTTSLEPA